ncbi:MAG: hypothetical protein H6684_02010 [Deltaproteobacteria bacterium]|nr:hypothetical protein [bacterium]MCB9477592.1 hypothetical protein [Deltaproteobacteria bacterium]MCB9487487.1 hypothetical protein [Deltaproteobacteria bacterium]
MLGRGVITFLIGAMVAGTIFAGALTLLNVGASELNEQQGISLRDGSGHRPSGFFLWYGTRSHMGGGLGGGK